MEILTYIRNDFNYKSMMDRIKELEMQMQMMQCQVTTIDCRTRNSYERDSKLDYGLGQLSEALKTLGIDPYKADEIRFQLKEAVKWNY